MTFGIERYEFVISTSRLLLVYTIPCVALIVLNYLLDRIMKQVEKRRLELTTPKFDVEGQRQSRLELTGSAGDCSISTQVFSRTSATQLTVQIEDVDATAARTSNELTGENFSYKPGLSMTDLMEIGGAEPRTTLSLPEETNADLIHQAETNVGIEARRAKSIEIHVEPRPLRFKEQASVRSNRASKNRRTTRMLIVVVTSFIIFEFPGHFLYNMLILLSSLDFLRPLIEENDEIFSNLVTIVLNLESIMIVISNSLNFPILYLMSTDFRSTFYSMLGLKGARIRGSRLSGAKRAGTLVQLRKIRLKRDLK